MKFHKATLMGVVAASLAVTTPFAVQAQEYLPPVIDRSSGGSQAAASKSEVSSVEARLTRLERVMDNKALVDMLMRLDALQTELQYLQGEQEAVTHSIEGIKQRQRDLYLDIDRRLQQLETSVSQLQASPGGAAAAPRAGSAMPGMTAPAVSAAVIAPTVSMGAASVATDAPIDPEAERQAYEKAFNFLKEGQYDQAITGFQGFLQQYAKGDYADNAQYWLGEANYVTRRFKAAEQEFLKVINSYPDSSKVSDAKLKLGYTYYELSEWESARKTLTELIEAQPGSTVARLAENRLQKMRLEGR